MSRDQLSVFAAFPARLAGVVRAAGAAPARDAEWGPEEVVRHLIAVDREVYQRRFRDLATGEGARWPWTEPGPWDGESGLAIGEVLERFATTRAETVALARSLDESAWARTGLHETFGPLDGAGVLREAVKHDEEHLAGLGR